MMIASRALGKSIVTEYAIQSAQTKPESSAVFVLEHQPRSCRAYPESGEMAFESIYVEVDGKPVSSPKWAALQERPACNSQAIVVDPATIKFTWDTSAASEEVREIKPALTKWGFGPIVSPQAADPITSRDTCTGPHESCCAAPQGDPNNCPASARTSDCDAKKACCCG